MVDSRLLTALAGLAVSIVVSVGIYMVTGSLLVFLFIPFVPFLFRGVRRRNRETEATRDRRCPRCGFRTRNEAYEYCPRDGTRLENRRDEQW